MSPVLFETIEEVSMTAHLIDLLLWMGALGVPTALLFAIFISTLGPEKPTNRGPGA